MSDQAPTFWPAIGLETNVHRLWLKWLVRLRWVALFTQVVVVSMSLSLLHTPWVLPVWVLVIAVLVAGNIRSLQTLREPSTTIRDEHLVVQLAMDCLALTCFFVFAGGSGNPFIVLFLIHIAMGAIMLPWQQSAALTAGVIAAYLLVNWLHFPLHYDRHALPTPIVLGVGQAVAFIITAFSVSWFVLGLSNTLRDREKQLLHARDRTAATDRLRTVGTLAAGAAHELNTPLSTVGLRLRRIARRHADDDTTGDLEAAQGQLDRCKDIVERLLVGAGDPSASEMTTRKLSELVYETVRFWEKSSRTPAVVEDDSNGVDIDVPVIAFSQALTALLENAREAQDEVGHADPILIRLSADTRTAVVDIIDRGVGLPSDNDRIGEPFFTTKDTGTGLGVFVARSVATGMGGGLSYLSEDHHTIARWWFPARRRQE